MKQFKTLIVVLVFAVILCTIHISPAQGGILTTDLSDTSVTPEVLANAIVGGGGGSPFQMYIIKATQRLPAHSVVGQESSVLRAVSS